VERVLAWYRVSSSVGALIALIAANAIPLIGVLFLGWSVWNILVVYWLENGIVGAFNILKIARAGGPADPAVPTTGRGPAPVQGRAALIPFFIVHYGLFWFVHGVFVLSLPFTTGMFSDGFGPGVGPVIDVPLFEDGPITGIDPGAGEPGGFDTGTIALAVVALTISHGLSYWWNFLRGGEYRRVNPARQMFAPYGRLVVLHLTIIFGAMAIIATGASAAAVAVLVVAKTLLDVGFHAAEHRRAGPSAVGSGAGG
jgi:hypothetical protein